jgi:hypothetical protein
MMVMTCSSRTNFEQQYSNINSTFNRSIVSESSWIERCKKRVTHIFKQISKSTTIINQQGKKIHIYVREKIENSFHLFFFCFFLTAC